MIQESYISFDLTGRFSRLLSVAQHRPLRLRRVPVRPVVHACVLRFSIAVLTFFATTYGVVACPEGSGFAEPRSILALYDGTREAAPRDTRLHRFAEFPLSHLGYSLEYYDVAASLPDDEIDARFAGVISWFDSPLAEASRFENWAAHVTTSCGGDLKQIVFGAVGLDLGTGGSADARAYLARLGLELSGSEEILGALATVADAAPEIIGYETDFSIEPGRYYALRATGAGKSLLRVAARDDQSTPALDLAVIGPQGAYVHASATLSYDARLGSGFWVLDPFAFFERLFSHGLAPIPDVTTANGRRIYFSTVSSDGWLALRPARAFGEEPQLASEILRDMLIAPFPDLPTTVAVLAGDLDPSLGGPLAQTGENVARDLFAMPQVQIASTGRSLIRNWDYFADYDREGETRTVSALMGEAPATEGGLVTAAVKGLGGAFSASSLSVFDKAAAAPRKYLRDSFDIDSEIPQAMTAVAELAPEGRSASTFLWSGDARPFEAALASVEAGGKQAIGGGGGQYNVTAPTVSMLQPFSAPIGAQVQVYNALSGDHAYTGYWTKPIFGFHAFAQTLDWTDRPRRLKPFQLAFSARSAIDFGTRSAIVSYLERARTGDVFPTTAAAYATMVKGFRSMQAIPEGPNAWRIVKAGAVPTVRFDHAAGLSLDFAASSGVLGARRHGDTLYVSLAQDVAEPVIALIDDPRASGLVVPATALALSESRFDIRAVQREACKATIAASGRGAGTMVWFGAPNRVYALRSVMTEDVATVLLDETIAADSAGRLEFTVPAHPGEAVTVTLDGQC